MILEFGFLIFGLILLIKGSGYLIDSSTKIARHYNVSELVIGLTLVSLGTSLPEFAISVLAAFSGHNTISIGNAIGSNIYNILVLTGTLGLLTRYKFKNVDILQRDIVWLLITAIWITLIGVTGYIGREMGIFFISLYLIYLIYLYNHNKKNKTFCKSKLPQKVHYFLLLGAILIYIGAIITVNNAILVAELFGISEWIISASLLGAGTGFPETFVLLISMKKRKLKMGIGALIGSNIFNILIVLGVAAIINPISFNFFENIESFLFLMIASVFLTLVAIKGSIHKRTAVISIGLYFIYIALLFT